MAGHDILLYVGTITDAESHMNQPPLGICTHCGNYTRDVEQLNQKCQSCNTALALGGEQKPGNYEPAVRTQRLLEGPERWRAATSAAVLAGPPRYSSERNERFAHHIQVGPSDF